MEIQKQVLSSLSLIYIITLLLQMLSKNISTEHGHQMIITLQ